MNKYVDFCGLQFSGLHKNEILDSSLPFQQIVTVGAEFIIEAHNNERLKAIINTNTSTFDGQVPYYFAQKKNKDLKFEKISGADFIYDVCRYAKENNQRIFLLGGTSISNPASVEKIKQMGVEAQGFVTGYIPYPFPKDRLNEILQKIAIFKPHYLFVGLGMCKQEFFIDDNRVFLEESGVRIAVGSGGTFEVFSGVIKRAPMWMQKSGLEGLYRVLASPSISRFKRLASTVKFLRYI